MSKKHGVRSSIRWVSVVAVLTAGPSLGAACDESRDRPTGLNVDVPPTSIVVRAPQPSDLLFVDSSAVITLRAEGLLQAVEFTAVSVSPIIDTIGQGRREFDPPLEFTEEQFTFLVPTLISGSTVQIVGVAENIIGQRTASAPVSVTVVDCDIEPFRCE